MRNHLLYIYDTGVSSDTDDTYGVIFIPMMVTLSGIVTDFRSVHP